MDKSDIAYLIAEQFFPDEKGVLRSLKTESMIYVQVTSVSSSEWFEGGRNGLNPELRFITNRFDYHGEEIIRYNGNYYRIYRSSEGRERCHEGTEESRRFRRIWKVSQKPHLRGE